MPDPISSTHRRMQPPDPETGPPVVARSRRGGWLWALLPLTGFALFGIVVWLAYQDVSRGPPVGEPPLVKAAADPIKLPPEQVAEPTGEEEGGTVGRLWSDTERADQPERLLPLPEEPLSPETVASPDLNTESPGDTAALDLPSSSEPPIGDRAPSAVAAPADAPAPPSGEREAPVDADAALDRLLAEVTALSEEAPSSSDAPPAPTGSEATVAPRVEESPALAARPSSTLGRTSPGGEEIEAAGTGSEEPLAETSGNASTEVRPAVALEPPASSEQTSAPSDGASTAPAPATQVAAIEDRFRIQVAAVREEADARRAWSQLEQDAGPVLSEVQPFFERAETANGVFYRVQIGRFATQQAAESLCAELKQRNASCFVVRR